MADKILGYRVLILSISCLCMSMLSSIAQVPDPLLSVHANKKTIKSVLDDISLQSGYFFTYDARLFDSKLRKTIHLDDSPMEIVLDSLFSPQKFSYTFIDKNIVVHQDFPLFLPEPESAKINPIRVIGKVLDKTNKKALEFVTIVLNGTNKGSLSNESGQFDFLIPDGIKNPILIFSMIGYENQHVAIDPGNRGAITVEMVPRLISLQEVVIRYIDPTIILKEGIRRIPENYLSTPSSMKAYFREFSLKNKEIMTFSEAVLEIDKQSYSNAFANDRAKLIKGRKISNVSSEDSLILKIQSGVYSSLKLDIIKNPTYFLQPDFEQLYNLEFSDITYFRDKLVYVINFNQKPQINSALYEGNIYIDQESLAIVAADFELNPLHIDKESSNFLIKKSRNIKTRLVSANYRVEYRKTDGFYHVNLVRGDVSFRFRKKRNWFSSTYKIVIELAITDVDTDDAVNIRKTDQLKPQSILSDELDLADSGFWNDYNIIIPEEELQEAVKRMGLNWREIGNIVPEIDR